MIQGFDGVDLNFGQGRQKFDGDRGRWNNSFQRPFEEHPPLQCRISSLCRCS